MNERIYAGTTHNAFPKDAWMIKYQRGQKEMRNGEEVEVKVESQFNCQAPDELGAIVEFIHHLKGLHEGIIQYDMNLLAILGVYRVEYVEVSHNSYNVFYQQVI